MQLQGLTKLGFVVGTASFVGSFFHFGSVGICSALGGLWIGRVYETDREDARFLLN